MTGELQSGTQAENDSEEGREVENSKFCRCNAESSSSHED